MKSLIDMAADRAPFIDQSQSLNMFMASPSFEKLSSMHFYAWEKGLKTGMYYLRTRPAADPIKFTLDKAMLEAKREQDMVLRQSQERQVPVATSPFKMIPVQVEEEDLDTCARGGGMCSA